MILDKTKLEGILSGEFGGESRRSYFGKDNPTQIRDLAEAIQQIDELAGEAVIRELRSIDDELYNDGGEAEAETIEAYIKQRMAELKRKQNPQGTR